MITHQFLQFTETTGGQFFVLFDFRLQIGILVERVLCHRVQYKSVFLLPYSPQSSPYWHWHSSVWHRDLV